MENIEKILRDLYDSLENKGMFIPLCVSNAIIAYKLAHSDEVYWINFSQKAAQRNIETIKDLYMFYVDFLPRENKFEKTFLKQIEHLRQFDIFLEEILYRQKYFYKNMHIFEKNLQRWLEKFPNPLLKAFATEIFTLAAKIKFES